MKNFLLLALLFFVIGCNSTTPVTLEKTAPPTATPPVSSATYTPQEGDVLFQSLPRSPLVNAIEDATGSLYSHCGIVAKKDDAWTVIEALGTVREIAFDDWIKQGRDSTFDAYRLNNALTPQIPVILTETRKFLGRPYDMRYRLDDETIYCSELVYKAVKNATGVELGKLEKLGDLNWQRHETFIRLLEGGELPLEREMISPKSLSEAKELTKVYGKMPRAVVAP